MATVTALAGRDSVGVARYGARAGRRGPGDDHRRVGAGLDDLGRDGVRRSRDVGQPGSAETSGLAVGLDAGAGGTVSDSSVVVGPAILVVPSFPRSAAGISRNASPKLHPGESHARQSLSLMLTFKPRTARYPRRSAGMTEMEVGRHLGQPRTGGCGSRSKQPASDNVRRTSTGKSSTARCNWVAICRA